MVARRHLIGRGLQQAATPNVTVVTTAGEQIPTWVVITVAGIVGTVACGLLLVLIIVIITQRKGTKADGAGGLSSSSPSKKLLPTKSSGESLQPQLIPNTADGWPFCMHSIEQVPLTVERRMPKHSLAEVRRATRDFAEDGLLGEGRYGGVYRGTLDNGQIVAVKRMHLEHSNDGELTQYGTRAEKEFLSEAEIIVRVHHRYLLPLIGYCSTRDERILILMYMEKGSLEAKLRDHENALDWTSRQRIAVGAAKGIAYLHEDCLPGILHRDVKSSNILLDESDEPRVADFGFARSREFGKLSGGSVQSQVVGTPGYLPIECVLFGQNNSVRSDVYAFGVVLLEILSGRPPVHGEVGSKKTLAHLARESNDYGRGLEDLIDPALGGFYDAAEALRMWNTALHCVSDDPSRRPRMGNVVLMLQGKQNVTPPSPEVQRLASFARTVSRKDRNPRDIRTSDKVDLWPRTADSPLERKISPSSPMSKILQTLSHGTRSDLEDNRSDRVPSTAGSEESPGSRLPRKRFNPAEYQPLEEGVFSEGVDESLPGGRNTSKLSPRGFNRAEYGPVEQYEGEVWKDDDLEGFDTTSLRWVPGQRVRPFRPKSPEPDTWQGENRTRGRSPTSRAAFWGNEEGVAVLDRELDEDEGVNGAMQTVRARGGKTRGGAFDLSNRSDSERYVVKRKERDGDEIENVDWGKRRLTRSLSNPLFMNRSINSNPLFSEKVLANGGAGTGAFYRLAEIRSKGSTRSTPLEEFPLTKVY